MAISLLAFILASYLPSPLNTPKDAGHGGVQEYKDKDPGDGVSNCRLVASDKGSNCSIVFFEEQMI